uniref:Uncharacterized protein n=2 Tax=Nothobranchius kadleci TaxID=1051664 RepID=A0A1A8CI31_NOTKA
MLKTWRIQRVHILRGCLSDPEISERIMYRYGGTLQLNHVPGEGAKVNIWIPVRGTSQQEGYHFHKAQWITGTHASTELFQAQAMTGVARWNYQRLVDLKRPDIVLPAVSDPALIAELNSSYKRVTGQEKYPTLRVSDREPAKDLDLTPSVSPLLSAGDLLKEDVQEFLATPDLSCAPPLPLRAYPSSARVGPIKTGGRVFVLDHTRWTPPMKEAIDDLLQKHHGDKEMLKLVDQEYAAIVHRAAADPNSLLHPTTRLHISRYVKHLAKLLNTSSSLNGPVRYFYCSQKVHQSYAAEGLSNPKMSFEDFSATDFFQRELDATKRQVQEKTEKKRQRTESAPAGRLCRFCHMELKQGPNSPHIHTGFPGVAGKYIYCPSKVFALYQSQGMVKEMSWKEFSKSPFYEVEKQRWVEEKNK